METTKWMKYLLVWAGLVAAVIAPITGRSDSGKGVIIPGRFDFKTFAISNQVSLSVEDINIEGSVVGSFFVTNSGPVKSFERFPNGNIVIQDDPRDKGLPTDPFGGITQAGGLNAANVVVGQFYDSAAGHYAGYFLRNGDYQSYSVPGYAATALFSVNDLGDFSGFVQNLTPSVVTKAFVNVNGHVTVFTIPGSQFVEATSINNYGVAVGDYQDAEGLYHGFIRDAFAHLTYPIDVPGVTTAAGLGTIPLGVNDFGAISGHFWDSAVKEHGFLRLPNGQYLQIDVPGAASTGGGGLNDFGVVVGHYNDQNGNQIGYIAVPDFDHP